MKDPKHRTLEQVLLKLSVMINENITDVVSYLVQLALLL